VGPRLLQPPQAEDDAVGHGAGGEGATAGHAGVTRPAPRLQVEGLKGGDRQLALTAPCTQTRRCRCQHHWQAQRAGWSPLAAVMGWEGGAEPPWGAPGHSLVRGGSRGGGQGCRGMLGLLQRHLPRTKILLPCRKAEAP